MATVTPKFIDSFGHAYYNVSLGQGMYGAIGGAPDGLNTITHGNSGWSLRTNTTVAEYVSFSSLTDRLNAFAFYVYFQDDLPAEDAVLMQFNNSNGNMRFIFDQSEGKFGVDLGSGASTAFGGPALSADTWYRCVVEFDSTTGTASIRATIDDTAEFSTTRSQTAANQTAWFFGSVLGLTTARTMLFGALVWSITDGDYETMAAWASHDVQDLRPTSDGTHNTGNGSFASAVSGGTDFDDMSTTVYQVVNQEPFTATAATSGALWQRGNDSSAYCEVIFEDGAATADIDAVRAGFTTQDASAVGSSFADMQMFLADGTTEVVREGTGNPLMANMDAGTNPQFTIRPMMAGPGGTWDGSEIDGLRFRFGFADGNPDTATWNYFIEVLSHTDPAPPGGGEQFMAVLVGV